MTADAADPRLAELTEALKESGLMQRLLTYFRGYAAHEGIPEYPELNTHDLSVNWAKDILAHWPDRTATTTQTLSGVGGYGGLPGGAGGGGGTTTTIHPCPDCRDCIDPRGGASGSAVPPCPRCSHPWHAHTATTEAEALAAAIAKWREAEVSWQPLIVDGGKYGEPWTVQMDDETFSGPTLTDAIAAALAATGGDWTEPQSRMPVDGGRA